MSSGKEGVALMVHGACGLVPLIQPPPHRRWGCEPFRELAERICCHNRHDAENGGFYQGLTLVDEMRCVTRNPTYGHGCNPSLSPSRSYPHPRAADGPVDFYCTTSGLHLFSAPVGRTLEEFLEESEAHGWPSFRDEEGKTGHEKRSRNAGFPPPHHAPPSELGQREMS